MPPASRRMPCPPAALCCAAGRAPVLASAAEVYGKNAVGMVLTGMGSDGVRGLKVMREAGALTLAQDEKSSAIYGMPRAAAEAGAARMVLPLSSIMTQALQALKEGG